ncbi:hypothetical protein [Psychrobacter sp. CAL346-MNA-CIBAN-0220]|uniref:hypothetical protein n=1 Tax=Psychrobacter sp. CAL346-MNA-CIBAN-0220 TaxID=3140457 RepID=UPI00332008EC
MFPFPLKLLISTIAIVSVMIATDAQATSSKVAADQPIRFAKGQISTTLTGTLNPKQHERWYQFEASSGQYALINIAPLAGTSETANVGVLHMPNGSQDGTKGGIIYQGCLPVSGTYRLRIARNLMATRGKTAGYTAEVIILPKYVSETLCP